MCGIVGARDDWLRSRGRSPEASVSTAVAALAWRGADGSAVRKAGGWWLGCARLAISAGDGQPVHDPELRTTVVMNGAVTNARDLWRRLAPGVDRRDPLPNDAALPGLAVGRGQPQLLDGLRGHHAYAVVDERTDHVYLGQDRYGERPLYCVIAETDGRWQLVAFASTIPALRRLGVDLTTSADSLAQWFRYGWSEARPTDVGEGLRVCELPGRGRAYVSRPAGSEWVEPALERDPASCAPPTSGRTLPELLAESITRCLDTPSAAGLCLSGGIDSSCLALTVGALGQAVPAYQFAARGAPTAERRAAVAVAEAAGLPLQQVDGDGVRVLLGGEGADELLLGYRRYRALQRMPRLPVFAPMLQRLRPWSLRTSARLARSMVAPNPVRALLAVTPPAFGREVLAEHLGAVPCWQDAEPLPRSPSGRAIAARDDDLANYLPRDLLPKLDVALLAAGVEGRCPYLEAGIEAFGADVDALGKRPLRAAFGDRLPDAVKRLPKRGFSLPLDAWFRGPLDALDTLAERGSRERPHLRPGGLARAVDRHRSGRADLGHGLYLLYAYELSLRAQENRP